MDLDFNASVALNLLLFLALFPIAFFWLRRAWRIIVQRDFSEVGLKRGESPPNPAKYAPFAAVVNLVGGIVVVMVIIGVVGWQLDFDTWTAMAGVTIWTKFFLDFALSRQAHPIVIKKKEKPAGVAGGAKH